MAPLRPSTAAHPGGAAGRRAGIWQHNLSRALVPVLLPTLARVIALVMMLINTLAGPRLREGVLLAEQVLVHRVFFVISTTAGSAASPDTVFQSALQLRKSTT